MQSNVICWILQTLFIGPLVFADKRLVKQDSFVCLFQNVTADDGNKDVNLYVNGAVNHSRIVTFTFMNGHISMDWNRHMADNYSKIFMDAKRNIWIANIDETYERKFYIQSSRILGELELTILKTRCPQNCDASLGNLAEEQIEEEVRKWLNDHLENIKGSLGNITEEQIEFRNWLADHPENIKGSLVRLDPLVLLIVMTVIGTTGMIILLCILANRNQIREGLINMKDWIQKKLFCQHMSENASQKEVSEIDIKEPELSQDQVHTWLNEHPDFMDTYLGKLTEDQIYTQIRNWMDAYPGLLKNKALDAPENEQVVTPTLDELSVRLRQHSGRGIEGNQNQSVSTQAILNAWQRSDAHENDQVVPLTLDELSVTWTQHSGTGIDGSTNMSVSTQEICIASQHSDEDGNDCQTVTPTLVEPPVTMTGSGNEIDGNQIEMSARKTFVDSEISDELVKNDTATDPTLSDLAVIWHLPVTGTEDNHGQLELSSTCNSPSAATFSVPGPSGIQPFNKDKQDANPAYDTEQDVRVDIEESDSEDKCQEPLMAGEDRM